jgi:hypothetical protein
MAPTIGSAGILGGGVYGALRAGLLAEYLFATDGSDSSGNSRNLTLFGNATATGRELTCDGTGDYATGTSLPALTALTVAAWVRVANLTAYHTIAHEWSESDNQRSWVFNVRGDVANDPIQVATQSTGGTGSVGAISILVNTSGQSWWGGANVWHYLVAVVEPSAAAQERIRLFVNGARIAATVSTSATPSIFNSSAPLSVGGNGAVGTSLNGSLSDVLAYNRALSETEIGTLYNLRPDLH